MNDLGMLTFLVCLVTMIVVVIAAFSDSFNL